MDQARRMTSDRLADYLIAHPPGPEKPAMTIVRRVRIEPDPDPCNPRTEWDCHVGRMVCWHRKYNLGDEHDYADPADFREDVDFDACVVLPLFLYDHSGITMSTGSFSCPWDSGQVGWIVCDEKTLRTEFNGDRERAESALRAEVEVYDAYISGSVYGFIVEERDGDDWKHVDSCWGFYGDDIHANGIADHLGDPDLVALAESAY
jgi:hypothetical protein